MKLGVTKMGIRINFFQSEFNDKTEMVTNVDHLSRLASENSFNEVPVLGDLKGSIHHSSVLL